MASPKVKSLMQIIRKASLSQGEIRELEELLFRMQSETAHADPMLNDFPPKVPSHSDDLNRAICLLGNRVMSDLKDKAKKELNLLIGVYPTPEQAIAWKQSLTRQFKALESSPEPLPAPSKRSLASFKKTKATSKKQKLNQGIQERFERFNEEADFLDRIGLGHLAAKLEFSDDRDWPN